MSGIDEFTMTSNELTIKFETVEQANNFKSWLCNQGEQDYWLQAEYDIDGDEHYADHFDYHSEHNVITATKVKEEDDE